MAPITDKRIDPEDGCAYTYDELWAFYKSNYKKKAIQAYWSDSCTPTKAKAKAKAKAEVRRATTSYVWRCKESVNDRAARLLKAAAKNGDAAETLYDDWSSSYDETLKNWNYPCPGRSAAYLKELLAAGAEGSHSEAALLDCGCGTGMLGEELHALGFAKTTGIDISQASLEVSRKKGVFVDLLKADLDTSLAFADGTFAGVLCVGTISYVPNVAGLLREFARVAKSGGIVLWTNRTDYWRDDHRACRSTAEKLVDEGLWENVLLTGEEDYLPNNPIAEDRALKIHYVGYRVR